MAKKSDPKEAKTSKKNAAKKSGSKKAGAKTDKKKKGGVKKYFRDLKSEIKKVVWPTRSKVINNTGVVLAVIVVMGVFLFGVDSLCSAGVNAILTLGS